jgi:hypothetical protein
MLRPDGTFTVGPLPPGDYRLRASVGFQPDEFAVATVTVSGSDLNDVQLVAAKPSLVRGRIVFDDSAAARPAAAAVHLNLAPLPSESYASGASATGNKDDTFELKAAAGRMLLRAGTSAPGGWHVDRVLLGDVDVTDDGFDIPQNGALEGLVVVLTTQHNTISGRVLDASGAFVRDCTIVVFAQDSRRWTYGSRYVSTARPDPQSVFHLRLPAGDYFAAAFAVDDQTPPLEREVLQQLVPYAIRFTIGPTETKTLEIAIGPAPEY